MLGNGCVQLLDRTEDPADALRRTPVPEGVQEVSRDSASRRDVASRPGQMP